MAAASSTHEGARLRRKLLTNSYDCELYALSSQKEAVRNVRTLLERSIDGGKGNSMLVIGSHGSGKTKIVRSALDQMKTAKIGFLTIFLNGLIHTDDRHGLLAIARQLDVESVLEDKLLLSFATAFDLVLEALYAGNDQQQSVIFVLEHFSLFTQHKNQTLLYNLFEIARHPVNPITILGITSDIEVMGLLEKRTKSRMAHGHAYVFTHFTFEEYIAIFCYLLQIPGNTQWNTHIKGLSALASVRDILRNQYNRNPSIEELKKSLIYPLSKLHCHGDRLMPHHFMQGCAMLCSNTDSKVHYIKQLSILELSLLVACKRTIELRGNDKSFNLEMILVGYNKFVSQRTYGKEYLTNRAVIMKAYQSLIDTKLIVPEAAANSLLEYQPMKLNVLKETIVEGVHQYSHCPTDLYYWATANILAEQ